MSGLVATRSLPNQPMRERDRVMQTEWDTAELQRDYEVIGFSAPFVVVRRKVDGVKGTLEFTHSPRVYFGFEVE